MALIQRTHTMHRLTPTPHRTIRTGDTVCCRRCGKQWDVRDEAPPCVDHRKAYEKFIKEKGYVK